MRQVFAAMFAWLALAAPPAFAQEGASPREDLYARIVQRAVLDDLVPAYAALDRQSGVLRDALGAYCTSPSERGGDVVRTGFADLLTAWAGVDFVRFGPMAAESRLERFAFWPDVHGTAARQLRQFLADKDTAVLDPGMLAKQSAAVQGLPALESLLFRGDDALLTTPHPDVFRCRLAEAIAENLAAIASGAAGEWRDENGFRKLMLQPSADNPLYRNHEESLREVLRALLTGLEQMRDQRLYAALGTSPQTSRAERAPYEISGNALPYIRASAIALRRFAAVAGIADVLPTEETRIASSIVSAFDTLDASLDAAGPNLRAALADPDLHKKLEQAALAIVALRDLYQTRLANAAQLTGGFNSLDGD